MSAAHWSWLLAALLLGMALALLRCRSRLRRLEHRHLALQQDVQRNSELRGTLERTRLIAEERERIYSDLHDDIGAKLLDLVYSAHEPEQADLARAILQDLRDVVSRSRGAPGTLSEVLGEIRAECEERLARVEAELIWDQAEALPDPQLDHGQSLHLFRIVREAVTNAIRHARARRVRVRVRELGNELVLDLTDDGPGPVATAGGGSGTDNMRTRASELHGSISWAAGSHGGTKVLLRVPLPHRDAQLP